MYYYQSIIRTIISSSIITITITITIIAGAQRRPAAGRYVLMITIIVIIITILTTMITTRVVQILLTTKTFRTEDSY